MNKELTEKVINEIKKYFPGVEIKHPKITYENYVNSGSTFGFGLADPKEEAKDDEYEYLERIFSATDECINEVSSLMHMLGELKFYKEPGFVFIRYVDCGDHKDFLRQESYMWAKARIVLGYKKS